MAILIQQRYLVDNIILTFLIEISDNQIIAYALYTLRMQQTCESMTFHYLYGRGGAGKDVLNTKLILGEGSLKGAFVTSGVC